MASISNILICASVALVLYSCLGLPLAARITSRPLAVMLAPGIGWAVHSVIALPLLSAIGLSRLAVVAVFGLPLIAAIVTLWKARAGAYEAMLVRAPAVALVCAALLALAVMAGVVPKISSEGVSLAAPIFDHSKIAMIDEMTRLGLPPGNPFFGGLGNPARLSYYYLWHFSAAELALLMGASGWEADAALTWFTAFASLTTMMGLAVWLGGRRSAAIWIVILAATASGRPVFYWLAGPEAVEEIAGERSGFGGWLFQTIWAPQHTASALCSVMAIFLLARWAQRRNLLTLLIFALTMVASFECSAWIGGVTLPLAAFTVAIVLLAQGEPHQRWRMFFEIAASAIIALLLISPFLYDQLQTTALRAGGSPIAITPYRVLSGAITDHIGGIFNLPAYWLIFLVVEFPAIYLTGIYSLFRIVSDRTLSAERKSAVLPLSLLLAVSLCAAWLLVSTLGDNNDLGWRAVLPAVLLLIVFSAVGLSRLTVRPLSLTFVAALVLVAIGLPDSAVLMASNISGMPKASSQVFAASSEMWEAVRRYSRASERIANNPLSVKDLTPWPVNISWALLSDRRSCYAGLNLAEPFTALPKERRERIDAQFIRVFAGEGTPEDVRQMATEYNCDLAVVMPQDGAWSRDPFAASPYAKLSESNAAWRIYRLARSEQR